MVETDAMHCIQHQAFTNPLENAHCLSDENGSMLDLGQDLSSNTKKNSISFIVSFKGYVWIMMF